MTATASRTEMPARWRAVAAARWCFRRARHRGFDDNVVLDKPSLDIYRGEILGFVGASGAGKSVLLRTILGLNRKQSGTIKLFGIDVDKATEADG